MLVNYVHPRLGLPKFHTFEPFFITALENFDRGEATRFEITGGLSPSTIAARLRDSLHGYRLNKLAWADRIDPRFAELFAKHDGAFVIAGPDEEGNVWLRQRHLPQKNRELTFTQVEGQLPKYVSAKSIPAGQTQPAAPSGLRAKSCTEAAVRSFVMLKSLGQLDEPVIFPGPLDPNLTSGLMAMHDIAFHYDGQRNETILV